MVKSGYNFYDSLKWVLSRIPSRRRVQFWISLFAMCFSAMFETFALGAIAFFASVVVSPQSVMDSKYFAMFEDLSGLEIQLTPNDLIFWSGAILIFLVFFKNTLRGMIAYWIPRFSMEVEGYFGGLLLSGFLNLPYEWHLSRNSADLVNAVQWRIHLGRGIISKSLKIVNDFLLVLVMLSSLFIIQPLVSFAVLATLGALGGLIYLSLRGFLDRVSTKGMNLSLTANKQATTAIHGVKDIKVANKVDNVIRRFATDLKSFTRVSSVQEFLVELPILLLETLGFTILALAIWIMMFFSNSSAAAVTGIISLLAVTVWKALPAVNRILSSMSGIRKALPFIGNQIMYLDDIEKGNALRPVARTNNSNVEFSFNESIKFNKVGFSYLGSNTKALQEIDFSIKKGETIGIIGTSGAGKSTLVNIITGLISPTEGQVYIDGKKIGSKLNPEFLALIGYVSQNPYILDGSLAENVAFGFKGEEINRERVQECCEMASISDFLSQLPEGIDTFIGERGVKISGGQQQRVAIARALYNSPQMMIFDEATSALDTKSEKAIQQTIYSFKGKQTLIIIAHRLSTVSDCDELIWIEQGKIRMKGQPQDVIEKYQRHSLKSQSLEEAKVIQ